MLGRKQYLSIFAGCIIASASVQAGPFSDAVKGEHEWVYKTTKNAETAFMNHIEDELEALYREQVMDWILDSAYGLIGDENAAAFTTLAQFVPAVSFAVMFQSAAGPSQSQLMLQTMLEAMSKMKNEIIDAVDAVYQDETEANLNALILELDIYNSRSDLNRQTAYRSLESLSVLASQVKKRIEQRTDKVAENSHLYMLASTLHFEIQREYTRWLELDSNPSASNAQIQSEIDTVFGTVLRDNYDFFNNGSIGQLNTWQIGFEDSFSDSSAISYSRSGPTTSTKVPVCVYLRGIKSCVLKTFTSTSDYYKYYFNSQPVEFKVAKSGQNRCPQFANYTIYNAEGVVTDSFTSTCGSSSVLSRVRASTDAIDDHKNDASALAKYVKEGYTPIADIMDEWWFTYYGTNRPDSEVDNYVANN